MPVSPERPLENRVWNLLIVLLLGIGAYWVNANDKKIDTVSQNIQRIEQSFPDRFVDKNYDNILNLEYTRRLESLDKSVRDLDEKIEVNRQRMADYVRTEDTKIKDVIDSMKEKIIELLHNKESRLETITPKENKDFPLDSFSKNFESKNQNRGSPLKR